MGGDLIVGREVYNKLRPLYEFDFEKAIAAIDAVGRAFDEMVAAVGRAWETTMAREIRYGCRCGQCQQLLDATNQALFRREPASGLSAMERARLDMAEIFRVPPALLRPSVPTLDAEAGDDVYRKTVSGVAIRPQLASFSGQEGGVLQRDPVRGRPSDIMTRYLRRGSVTVVPSIRTVRVTSDGTPTGTFVVDDATGKELYCKSIVFDPLTVGGGRWMATLLLAPSTAYDRDNQIEPTERVYVKIGLEPGRCP